MNVANCSSYLHEWVVNIGESLHFKEKQETITDFCRAAFQQSTDRLQETIHL